MTCNKSLLLRKWKKLYETSGNVQMVQGTLFSNEYTEYNGDIKQAYATGCCYAFTRHDFNRSTPILIR
jgi:hypothetical protein